MTKSKSKQLVDEKAMIVYLRIYYFQIVVIDQELYLILFPVYVQNVMKHFELVHNDVEFDLQVISHVVDLLYLYN
jgi:hypothetical protein